MRTLRWPRFWLGLWIAAIIVVIVLSLVPPPPLAMEMPEDSDKLLHFLAYFGLALAATQLFETGLAMVVAAVGLVGLGVSLEWAQGALMPQYRSADAMDALANTLGVGCGSALWFTALARCLQRLEPPARR